MIIPDFILKLKNKYASSKKRKLEEFSHIYEEINVARDVVDFKFIMKSDEDPDNVKFFLNIMDWTESNL